MGALAIFAPASTLSPTAKHHGCIYTHDDWNRRWKVSVDPPTNCYGAASGRGLRLMGNSKGRDNAKKRARRRKKTERLALAKNKKKTATKQLRDNE
jgi:hypothetical protein